MYTPYIHTYIYIYTHSYVLGFELSNLYSAPVPPPIERGPSAQVRGSREPSLWPRKCASKGIGRQGVHSDEILKSRNCLQKEPVPCRLTPLPV